MTTTTSSARSFAAALFALGSIATSQASSVVGQGTWQETLLARTLDGDLSKGVQAYYDTQLNITWSLELNTGGRPLTGDFPAIQQHSVALALVNSLVINGVSGWRLPNTVTTKYSPNGEPYYPGDGLVQIRDPAKSELAHMYAVTLGNAAGRPVNSGPFSMTYGTGGANIFGQTSGHDPYLGNYYFFDPFSGRMREVQLQAGGYVWAVHDGDVGFAMSIPEPATNTLAILGLIGICYFLRRKNSQSTVQMSLKTLGQ